MRIVAGTYEGFCYGWEFDEISGAVPLKPNVVEESDSSHAQPQAIGTAQGALAPTFGYSVHVGCMKSAAVATSGNRGGKILVTGGADERIRIYDLQDRKELGELQQHNGKFLGDVEWTTDF